MRRMTRRIGVFGSPAAMASQSGIIRKPSVDASGAPPADETNNTDKPDEAKPSPAEPATRKKSWLRRLFGGD